MRLWLLPALAPLACAWPAQAQDSRAGCALPKPSAAAKVLLLSAYEGAALSSTTIGSQDIEVRTAAIEVEPGSEALYVVALSYRPMIWRFTGALERVERVVVAAQLTEPNTSLPFAQPIVGASGMAADKITLLPRPTCLEDFSEVPSAEASRTIGTVRSETGKEPIVAADYSVSGISVPSAALQPPVSTADGAQGVAIEKDGKDFSLDLKDKPRLKAAGDALDNDVARFYPGGIVEIDPDTVVASGTTARYEVLPGPAGLRQLVRSGALSRNQWGEFAIREKLRFPAGLYGAQSARFVLLPGVPAPEGNPGHSCVMKAEAGKPPPDAETAC